MVTQNVQVSRICYKCTYTTDQIFFQAGITTKKCNWLLGTMCRGSVLWTRCDLHPQTRLPTVSTNFPHPYSLCTYDSQFLQQLVFITQWKAAIMLHVSLLLHSLTSFLRWRCKLDATNDDWFGTHVAWWPCHRASTRCRLGNSWSDGLCWRWRCSYWHVFLNTATHYCNSNTLLVISNHISNSKVYSVFSVETSSTELILTQHA